MKGNLLGIGFAVLALLLICSEVIVAKLGLDTVNVMNIVWLQYIISLIGFMIMVRYVKFQWQLIKPNKVLIFFSSLSKLANVYFFYSSIFYLFPDFIAVTSLSGDLFIIFGGILFLKESFRKKQIIGLLMVVAGLAIYFYQTVSEFSPENLNVGLFYLVLSQFCWAFYALSQKTLIKKDIPPCNLNFFTFLFTSVAILPFVNFGEIAGFSLKIWVLITITALITLYTYTALLKAFQFIDANRVSIILSSSPFLTVVLVYGFNFFSSQKIELSELGIIETIGGIILITGIIISNWKSTKNKNPL
ncbi:DMT family transporter [Aureivirga marina]|uniref:DMT family transporter n=1 Tax=Aureivirga marina TaxID=1182451 RepID=UPI0018C9C3A2|nr:DMT family transporter [Aureivirga marina]